MNIHQAVGRSIHEDVPAGIESWRGEDIAAHLERRVLETLARVEAAECWKLLMNPATSPALAQRILTEVYLEIAMYQPEAIEAAIASIGQMPRDMPVSWLADMLHHQVEEFDHGEMAIRDFASMGGAERYARTRKPSPSAFAVAAMWRYITHKRDPFLYLGAVYLFDGLTPIVTEKAMGLLSGAADAARGMEFIIHHATADIAHTAAVRQLIVDVGDKYPHSIPSIALGYEYFAQVYPLPGWEAAVSRAQRLQAQD